MGNKRNKKPKASIPNRMSSRRLAKKRGLICRSSAPEIPLVTNTQSSAANEESVPGPSNIRVNVSEAEENIFNHPTSYVQDDVKLCTADFESTFLSDASNASKTISGRRIVSIQHFFNELSKFQHHSLFSCNNNFLEMIGEKRIGLISKFKIKCNNCKIIKTISSEPIASDFMMDVNKSIVLGTISTGGGYSQLQEMSAICDLPCMSSHQFQKTQKSLSEYMKETAWELIEQAGREEYNIAVEKNQVGADGIPYITVIADGAWSKRSYKKNYDALSGVAVIVGQATGKILYLGIRNKHCCICSRAASKNVDISPHMCYKNWNGPSTGMESDIIADGFHQSIKMHNLKYSFLVGDGDSSVYRKLLQRRPYTDQIVQKIECRNHLLRNYCNKLKDICGQKYSSKMKKIPITLRKLLERNIKRMRCGIQCAIKHYVQETIPHHEKVQKLRQDIFNSPYHTFGEHENCAAYFCKGNKENETNSVTLMKECGIFDDILIVLDRIARNSESLILNLDNNSAEHYNSILVKFTGGKRINFSMRRSFMTRCEAALITFNSPPGELPRLIHKKDVKKSPGMFTKKYIQQKKRQRTWFRSRRQLFPEKTKKKVNVATSDADYGPYANETMEPEDYEEKCEEFLQSLVLTPVQIYELERATVGQVDCLLWKQERENRLTASVFGIICRQKVTTHCAALVYNIRYSIFQGNEFTRWGRNHESVAIRSFSEQENKKIEACGLFVDEEHPFLGASPDGLIGNDAIIEIKCPVKAANFTIRDAIEEKKIKFLKIENNKILLKKHHQYYYQVQGQLHITKRQFCYFVVWSPHSIEFDVIYRDDNFWKNNMFQKLEDFYMKCLLPEIINPQYRKEYIKDLRKSQ